MSEFTLCPTRTSTLARDGVLDEMIKLPAQLYSEGKEDTSLSDNVKKVAVRYTDINVLASLMGHPGWYDTVQAELQDSFRVLLSKVVVDTDDFRCMMRKTRCVISGSMALYYLQRLPLSWTPRDTDLVCPRDSFDDVVEYVKTLAGSHVLSCFDEADEPTEYSLRMSGFDRLVKVRTPLGVIDIMRSKTVSALYPVAHYWGTHVMNVLTADNFISAYPSATIHGVGYFTTTPKHDAVHEAIEKYRRRGFTLSDTRGDVLAASHGDECDSICANVDRFFGDDKCLVVPIGDGGYTWVEKKKKGAESVGWRLGGKACGTGSCFLPSEFTVRPIRFGGMGRIEAHKI